MLADERQDKIYDMVKRSGAVTTSNLVDFFGVSIETIRRDLLSLEQNGRLTRVHGGAVAKIAMKPFKELIRSCKVLSSFKDNCCLSIIILEIRDISSTVKSF